MQRGVEGKGRIDARNVVRDNDEVRRGGRACKLEGWDFEGLDASCRVGAVDAVPHDAVACVYERADERPAAERRPFSDEASRRKRQIC
jgi:hypothetical protein